MSAHSPRTHLAASCAHGWTRREALATGGRVAAGGLLAGGLAGLLPGHVHAIDWSSLFRDRMPDISGTVRELEGMAYAARKPLHVGDSVPSGALVQVAKGGRVVVSLADGGIFTVYGGSEIELFLEKMSQGLLHLLTGALLMVAPKGSHYLVAGVEATFGIKGTVVFRKVIGPGDRMMHGMGGDMAIPAGADGYFCLCHGEVDFLHQTGPEERRALSPFLTDSATHHNARFLFPTPEISGLGPRPPRVAKAPMLEHSDTEIRRLIGLQEGPKHDASWLEDR